MAGNERLVELFEDLVDNYLKEFIRKNKVTPTEYRQAVKFLEKAGNSGEIPLMMDVFLETTVDEVAYGFPICDGSIDISSFITSIETQPSSTDA
jgi:hypothetical protein